MRRSTIVSPACKHVRTRGPKTQFTATPNHAARQFVTSFSASATRSEARGWWLGRLQELSASRLLDDCR